MCSCKKAGLVGLLSVFHWLVFTLTADTVQGILVAFGLEDAPSKEEPSLVDKPALQRLYRRGS